MQEKQSTTSNTHILQQPYLELKRTVRNYQNKSKIVRENHYYSRPWARSIAPHLIKNQLRLCFKAECTYSSFCISASASLSFNCLEVKNLNKDNAKARRIKTYEFSFINELRASLVCFRSFDIAIHASSSGRFRSLYIPSSSSLKA